MASVPSSSGDRLVPPLSITALVLDFDGTIVDTETPTLEGWREVYRRHGCDLALADWQPALGTHGGFDPYAHLVGLTAGGFGGDGVRQEIEDSIRRRCAEQPLRPGVAGLVEEARAAGLRLAVASSSSLGWVERHLGRHGLRDRFDHLVCRDHVRQVKPAPDLYLSAARELGVEPGDCVAIEDSPNGVRAARSAGMRCVVVPNPTTAGLDFPPADLKLESLAGVALRELLEQLNKPGRQGRPGFPLLSRRD